MKLLRSIAALAAALRSKVFAGAHRAVPRATHAAPRTAATDAISIGDNPTADRNALRA